MSYDEFEARKDAEIKALEKLKNSFFLFGMIQTALVVVYTITLVSAFLMEFEKTLGITSESPDLPLISMIFYGVVYFVYALFVAYFLNTLKNGSEMMEPIVPRIRIMRYGVIAYYIGVVLAIPSQMLMSVSIANVLNAAVFALSMGAAAVIFTGMILIAIGAWRIGSHYHSSDLHMGAVLLILLSFIGAFILSSAFAETIRKVKRRVPPPPAPPWL